MLVDMPSALRESIQNLTQGYSVQELSRSASDLSARYREDRPTGAPIARSAEDVAAYGVYRLPATYAAIVAVLRALQEQRPDWRPKTLLDLGAGLGAGLWAATEVWPDIEQLTAIDAQPAMISMGREICRTAANRALRSARWSQMDLNHVDPAAQHDIVLISYVLAELTEAHTNQILDRAWRAAGEALVIVEPGTPAGYRRVQRARDHLRSLGAFSLAPCPHDPPCQVPDNDWIHFSVRLPRSKTHRSAKGAELGYEDEKYAYLVMAREPVARSYARILRHPQIRKGHIYLELCTSDGVKTIVVSKRDRERFNRARKAAWGDIFELPNDDDHDVSSR